MTTRSIKKTTGYASGVTSSNAIRLLARIVAVTLGTITVAGVVLGAAVPAFAATRLTSTRSTLPVHVNVDGGIGNVGGGGSGGFNPNGGGSGQGNGGNSQPPTIKEPVTDPTPPVDVFTPSSNEPSGGTAEGNPDIYTPSSQESDQMTAAAAAIAATAALVWSAIEASAPVLLPALLYDANGAYTGDPNAGGPQCQAFTESCIQGSA